MSKPLPSRNSIGTVLTADERLQRRFPASLKSPAIPAEPVSRARQDWLNKLPSPLAHPTGLGLDSDAVRKAMVMRLAQRGLSRPAVLQALAEIERHRFVDSALAQQAYSDTSLPIGMGQTISKPSIVGRMLELVLDGIQESPARVLEIGTGCGYQAALLSRIAHEVYSIERLRVLHEKARTNLRHLRLPNLHLILGDGMQGYPAGAGYGVIVSAASAASIPSAWLDQLAPGGRLIAPVELERGQQHLMVVDRTARGFVRTVLERVHFVPLKSGIA